MLINLNKYESIAENNLKLRYDFFDNYKWIFFIFINVYFFYFIFQFKHGSSFKNNSKIPLYKRKLIEENFFVIDSNNLDSVKSHMYGYSISKNGFLTDNYYKKMNNYEEPESLGAYVMVRLYRNEIIINQDFYGSFGLYYYEEKNSEYFALSNSFLLLEEYLVKKKNISLNKDFADNFITSWLCTPSIYETMIKEIIRLPSNAFIIINIKNKSIKINYIDYKENTIPFESEQGLKIIDEWVDKWTYIIRSLKKETNNIYFDLTGGFDSRAVLSIFLNTGIDANDMSFNTLQTNLQGNDEDLLIANNISLKLGFTLNKLNLDKDYTKWSPKDTIFCSMYSKSGSHKEFYLERGFFSKPRIAFTGGGGDFIKGGPGYPIEKLVEMLSSGGKKFIGYQEEFYESSKKLCDRSVILLKNEKVYNNDYEISSDFFSRVNQNHFGKKALEGFMANIYFLQPLIDPDLRKIKYNISGDSSHDLISYIYLRFAKKLLDFPFQGNRTLNQNSIKKSELLNNKLSQYKIKSDYNSNFFLDNKRESPVPQTKNYKPIEEYLVKLFKSKTLIKIINSLYNNSVCDWANDYNNTSNFISMKQGYGLLAVALALEHSCLNEIYMKNIKYETCFGVNGSAIMKYLIKIK